MQVCLFSDSLFNLADNVLNFARVLFSSAVGFKAGVVGKLAGLLLDCAFDFVNLACCLIARAQFHGEVLLCSMVGFNRLRSIEISLRLEDPRPGKILLGRFPCLMRSLLSTSLNDPAGESWSELLAAPRTGGRPGPGWAVGVLGKSEGWESQVREGLSTEFQRQKAAG